MRKALFVSYGGGHVAMVIPTVQELQRRGNWQSIVLGLTTAAAKLQQAGIPSLGFRDLLQPDDSRSISHGKRLASENHTAGTGVAEEESIAYLGLSYSDLEDRVGVETAAVEYATRKRHAFLPVGPLKRLIQRENPDVVVATCSPRSERAAILAAAECGIPSITMVDLFGREWDFLYDPNYGDKTCVMSPAVRDDYLRRGRRSEDVLVTGNPAFDRLADSRCAVSGESWRQTEGLADKRVVLWTDTIMLSAEHRSRVFKEFSRCAQTHPDWHFVYRPHPSMAVEGLALPPNCTFGSNRIELATHLHAADCVLVTISTCGIEAALLDKPVVKLRFVDPQGEIYTPEYARVDTLAPYEEMGIVVPCTSIDQLRSAIVSALPGGQCSAALKNSRKLLPPIGEAARKVAEAMEALVDSSRNVLAQRKHVA